MKKLLWLGLVFLSTSWMFFIPIFILPNYFMGLLFIIIGILCNTFAFWGHDFKKFNNKYFIILIPLLIFIFIIPVPYSLGPMVLIVGIFLYFIKINLLKNDKANWLFIGISFSGLILIIQTLFFPIYTIFVSHGHRIDILSPIISFISGIFGLNTSLNNGIIIVHTYQQIYPFTTTLEKLGFYPWFNMFSGALLIFLFLPKLKKISIYILGFLLISGLYIIIRYVFIIFVFTQRSNISLFWDPIFLLLSFIPFALLLIKFAPLNNFKLDLDCFEIFKLNKNRILAIAFIFLFVFSIVGVFVFKDPGTEKTGKILIDEFHSDWEDTTRKMDKEWYGMLSTYNYYCLAELLDKYYTIDRNINNTLSLDLLKNYDILILKCPTNAYSNKEVRSIVQFVNNGGGLYLIGDHTNVFGMNYYLNQVSKNFGITFKTDATYELGTNKTSIYKPDAIFPHPIVQNLAQFNFLTSCSLNAPITSENVIIGNRVIAEPGTYSTDYFFREPRDFPDIEYGLILQVAVVKHNMGRILAFSDSTCFSNFCIFMDGYKAFNLGAIEYLNRSNTYSYLNTIFIGIAVISLCSIIYILKKENKNIFIFLVLVSGLLSFSIATPVFSYINDVNYQLPSANSEYTKVCFDEEHSDIVITYRPTPELYNSNKFFGTFFVWTQRVGCFPSLERTLENAIKKGDIIVIINPVESFLEEEINAITEYIKQGGRVLLMDSILNAYSTSNKLLGVFNISINYNQIYYNLYKLNKTLNNTILNNSNIGKTSVPYLIINGGDDIFITEKTGSSIAIIKIGRGKIVIVLDSYTFSDKVLGGPYTEPNESLRQIYDTEFYIFEELLLKDG